MKLVNCDLRTFITYFGIEGVHLVENHDVEIYLVNNETALALGLGDVKALTAGNWNRKAGEAAAMMFFNMDLISASIDPLRKNIKGSVEKICCSYLVHELCHVKQIIDGRMGMKNGKLTWEGEAYEVKNDGSGEYFAYPWEQEAYMTQFTYELGGDKKAARKHLDKLAKAA